MIPADAEMQRKRKKAPPDEFSRRADWSLEIKPVETAPRNSSWQARGQADFPAGTGDKPLPTAQPTSPELSLKQFQKATVQPQQTSLTLSQSLVYRGDRLSSKRVCHLNRVQPFATVLHVCLHIVIIARVIAASRSLFASQALRKRRQVFRPGAIASPLRLSFDFVRRL